MHLGQCISYEQYFHYPNSNFQVFTLLEYRSQRHHRNTCPYQHLSAQAMSIEIHPATKLVWPPETTAGAPSPQTQELVSMIEISH